MCAQLVEHPHYRARLKKRLLAGDLPPALECLIWHYAYGRPKETSGALGSQQGNVTQVNLTEVYLDRLSTEQLDQLDRLLELAGLEGPQPSAVTPTLEVAPVPSHQDRP